MLYNEMGGIVQRYFVKEKINDGFMLSEEDTYHITKVMRMKVGDLIEVVFQHIVYICEIISFTPNVYVQIREENVEQNELSIEVTIVQSLVKEQKMDYILQKSTELGVSRIIPYQAERSLIKLDGKQEKKRERWQSIVKEAAEQSKRNDIPVVDQVLTLSNLVKLSDYDSKFLCTVNESDQNLKKVLSNISGSAKILFVIGPEGGFTSEEEKEMTDNHFIPLSLGNSVLRTETASTFIMSVIRYIDME